eukprot:919461-Alexandrium_andersonii.AAC.1
MPGPMTSADSAPGTRAFRPAGPAGMAASKGVPASVDSNSTCNRQNNSGHDKRGLGRAPNIHY